VPITRYTKKIIGAVQNWAGQTQQLQHLLSSDRPAISFFGLAFSFSICFSRRISVGAAPLGRVSVGCASGRMADARVRPG
jgi:hypothetical protein